MALTGMLLRPPVKRDAMNYALEEALRGARWTGDYCVKTGERWISNEDIRGEEGERKGTRIDP